MTDTEEESDNDFTIATADEIQLKRVGHVVTNPIRPRGGSTGESEDDD